MVLSLRRSLVFLSNACLLNPRGQKPDGENSLFSTFSPFLDVNAEPSVIMAAPDLLGAMSEAIDTTISTHCSDAGGSVSVVVGSLKCNDDDDDVVDYEDDDFTVSQETIREAVAQPARIRSRAWPGATGASAFGISYQKYETASATEPPAFEGETELERELNQGRYAAHLVQSMASVTDDDDEFDFNASCLATESPVAPPESRPEAEAQNNVLSENLSAALAVTMKKYSAVDRPAGSIKAQLRIDSVAEEEDEEDPTVDGDAWQSLPSLGDEPQLETPLSSSDGSPVTMAEVKTYFGLNCEAAMPPPKKAALLTSPFFRRSTSSLDPGLFAELEAIMAIATVDYDPTEPMHYRMLKTCYDAFVPQSGPRCCRIGAHWELVGFQGSDPRTDLNRSIKCLAIIQLLALIEADTTFAMELYALANAQGNDWPFACTSIAFSKDALVELDSGRLNAACNNAKAVLPVFNAFHRDLFLAFRNRLNDGEDRFEALNRTRKLASAKKVPKRAHLSKATTTKTKPARPGTEPLFDSIDAAAKSAPQPSRQDSRMKKYASGPS